MEKISIHNMKWNLIYNLNLPSTTIIKEKGERGQRGQCVCVCVSECNEWMDKDGDRLIGMTDWHRDSIWSVCMYVCMFFDRTSRSSHHINFHTLTNIILYTGIIFLMPSFFSSWYSETRDYEKEEANLNFIWIKFKSEMNEIVQANWNKPYSI